MRSLLSVATAAGLVVLGAAGPAAADSGDGDFTIKDPRIKESSGLAASRAHPGIYWTHNDSDDGPYVYAVDSRTGETVARITLTGVGRPRDVEAISVGSDGNVYVGDIGDNLGGTWKNVWIYKFPEPARLKDATVKATQYVVKYADGPRNAEALMVHPKTGRLYIASKKEGGGGLYEGPERLSSTGTNVFRRVDDVPWVTDGAFSPDGSKLALRGYFWAAEYDWKNGKLGARHGVSAPLMRQAESVTYTSDGEALLFGSEGVRSPVVRVAVAGGGKSPSGTGSSPSGGGADKGGDSGDGNRNLVYGALAVVGAGAAWVGLKRRFRRG
ncbi:WD40 repeat domain-containing protein [Streptomyces melanogenes]|uniref:WD40 repeat domain-containing protein n=2 Tax=Streptomyces melanogenes TaxID=67326 RepID=A0ABZ1XVI0_9ACTN|nr:WD40 repeat domain-containing protein [Streptomyces melanogenes]